MDLNKKYSFEYLKNEAEELVKKSLAKHMKEDKTICDCEECVIDIIGLTLNSIKPLYRTSLKGGLYTTAPDKKYLASLEDAIKAAIQKIKNNPSHN